MINNYGVQELVTYENGRPQEGEEVEQDETVLCDLP
jgi:hypothetical protein